jgi:CRISPR-associated endonuclease/helicase Cas3
VLTAVDFSTFFKESSGGRRPRPYQQQLAVSAWPETLIVPTGFGKTAAVLSAWLWKSSQSDPETPRRLVYCLPMRTLVEQTEDTARGWIAAAKERLGFDVQLDVLMGGRGDGRRGSPGWIINPERPTILIGTQDLLVSAALMRGYGTTRYRWPVDFALLHNGALWVFDEVQLAGAAITTSAQLEAFRREFRTERPSRTLWMSATLDPSWLKTIDFTPKDKHRPHDLSTEDIERARHLWTAQKRLHTLDFSTHDLGKKDGLAGYAQALAKEARGRAKAGANTILFLNTVARAQAVYAALRDADKDLDPLLIHSRFRAADRRARTDRLRADPPAEGRIIVTTQALEAGVDLTSSVMMTEIAPWSSLVQRFGRCNRYGECGEIGADVFWIDLPAEAVAPYEVNELADACKKLAVLPSCGPAVLATIPPSAPPRGHVVRKRDLFDLFDTDPDLSGFDVDVSLYVRDADDTDVRLFWRPVEEGGPSEDDDAPSRNEICPVPIGGAKDLITRAKGRAWRWDPLAKKWQSVRGEDVFPGLVLWIDSEVGGYSPDRGFDPSSKMRVEPIDRTDDADAPEGLDDDADAQIGKVRVSLARHTAHVRNVVDQIAREFDLGAEDRKLLTTVAVWHDVGKGHPAFVALTKPALTEGVTPPLAKWPKSKKGEPRPKSPRRHFRHELASALTFLAHRGWSEQESLAAYLIAAHHGKVRMRLRALPKEQPASEGKLFARGVHDGDILPATCLDDLNVSETVLDLDIMQLGDSETCGPSWSARTQRLLTEHGPFRLAWLEALVRIADWRASNAEEEAGRDDL